LAILIRLLDVISKSFLVLFFKKELLAFLLAAADAGRIR
jgi:hypothetical protein